MLEKAHKALEAMSAACTAMKGEQWGEAERSLHQVQETVGRLLRFGEKVQAELQVPPPEAGEWG